MSHLFQALAERVDAWRTARYDCPDFPAIREILDFAIEDPATGQLRYLRHAQFRALETYWYLRLVLNTPRIPDLYATLFPKPKERREAMGLTAREIVDMIADAGLDTVLERLQTDNAFVRKHGLESLRETFALDYPSYILALAMGAGKTILMGSIVATEFAMALEYPDGPFVENALVFAPGKTILSVQGMTVPSRTHKKDAVRNVSFDVRAGEIVCLAGIEGNGQTELVYGLTGLEKISGGTITLDGQDITHASIRQRSKDGMSHIPEDRHKHGLVLDYSLENNMVLQRYWQPEFQKGGFIQSDKVREYSDKLIAQYDVRSGQGSSTIVRSMSGGNQQKAIIAREIDKDPKLLVAVQPTRGLDVGAIEYIHRQIVAQRDKGKAVLLVSLELDEVMNLSDRILVMYEGEIVGELDPKSTTQEELGLYMAGAKRDEVKA